MENVLRKYSQPKNDDKIENPEERKKTLERLLVKYPNDLDILAELRQVHRQCQLDCPTKIKEYHSKVLNRTLQATFKESEKNSTNENLLILVEAKLSDGSIFSGQEIQDLADADTNKQQLETIILLKQLFKAEYQE